jgi:hypothetical protein
MSDICVHHFPTRSGEQYDNLLTLARHLVSNASKIDADCGLLFDLAYMPVRADAGRDRR